MRKLLVIACMGLIATAAYAAPLVEFYFSKQSCADVTAIPAEYGDGAMLTAAIGEDVYLWAATPLETTPWMSIALCFTGDVTSGAMGREKHFSAFPPPGSWTWRWESGADFDPADDDCINLINVTAGGIGAWTDAGTGSPPWADDFVVMDTVNWVGHYCLGSIDWGDAGYKFMSVASGLVVRGSYTTSTVWFGFDATGAPELGGSGVQPGVTSPRADIYITPEPASLVLLALAGLALRRR